MKKMQPLWAADVDQRLQRFACDRKDPFRGHKKTPPGYVFEQTDPAVLQPETSAHQEWLLARPGPPIPRAHVRELTQNPTRYPDP